MNPRCGPIERSRPRRARPLGALLAFIPAAALHADHVPFAPPQAVVSPYDLAPDLRAADLDGDGDADVIATAWTSGSLFWWENVAGDGSTWLQHLVADGLNGPRSVEPIDLDADGDADLVAAMVGTDEVLWWENLDGCATEWSLHVVDNAFNGSHGVAVADYDGDGDLDIAAAAADANEIAWWENLDGAGLLWQKHVVDVAFAVAFTIVAGDLDGDGDADLAASANGGAEIAWWENVNAAGTAWSKHVLDDAFVDPRGVSIVDLDGDTDLDIIGAAGIDDEIRWWENVRGDGSTWTSHVVASAYDGAQCAAAADFDGDGDLDLVSAALFDESAAAWWENLDGSGLAWQVHPLEVTLPWCAKVTTGDLDGDGDPDALGGWYGPDGVGAIMWWANGLITGVGPAARAGSSPCACPADCGPAGGDGVVNIVDLLDLLAAWGGGGSLACDLSPVGGDGTIDILDLLALLASWGPCP